MLDGNLENFQDFEKILKILRIFREFFMFLKKKSKNLQNVENQKINTGPEQLEQGFYEELWQPAICFIFKNLIFPLKFQKRMPFFVIRPTLHKYI